MAVYQIVELGDPVLREIARPVPKITTNIVKLLENMADTMYEANGVGLAAPQIGISKRVIVVDTGDGLIEIINPQVISLNGKETAVEGCLSVPGVQGEVIRGTKILVKGMDRKGNEIEISGTDLLARVLQHEIDHLDGIIFIDKVIRFVDMSSSDSGENPENGQEADNR